MTRLIDSGPQLFLRGEHYYRQLDDLAINLCVAKAISDDGWREYLDGSLAVAKRLGQGPKVAMITFVHAHPNAGQRRMSAEFIARNDVRAIERVALLSDSALLRGAMTAFSWFMPKANLRAFGGSDTDGCLRWLRKVGTFDEQRAAVIWSEARSKLGIAGAKNHAGTPE